MGICKYCGQHVGFLRNKHRECTEKHNNGWAKMVQMAKETALGKGILGELETSLTEVARNSFIQLEQVKEALVAGWEQAVGYFLEDGNLNVEEEAQLTSYAKHYSLTQNDLDKNGIYTQFVKGAVIRELLEGKIPNRFHADNPLPFNFQKSESLIWGFGNVAYYEDKTRRQYVGASHGISFRIAKGVYYRMGSFKGHPVETTERVRVDTGILAVTTKHIYFGGNQKNFRIRLSNIVSFIPFSNGVGIQRDAATAKPQFFLTNDGWFTYNLLSNTANMFG